MIIAGLDISLTSPGVVKAELDDENLNIKKIWWFGFTTVNKVYKKCKNNLFFYQEFRNYIDRTIWIKDIIEKNLYPVGFEPDYVAIEDYAFSTSTGMTFHIGGFTEILKLMMYQWYSKIRLYDIKHIKKFATGNGNSDKIHMYDDFMKIPLPDRIDISNLPIVSNTKGNKPTSDIIDAYYIMKLLQLELKLRRGIMTQKDLTEEQNWVFNRVTETSEGNILSRDFIEKRRI